MMFLPELGKTFLRFVRLIYVFLKKNVLIYTEISHILKDKNETAANLPPFL